MATPLGQKWRAHKNHIYPKSVYTIQGEVVFVVVGRKKRWRQTLKKGAVGGRSWVSRRPWTECDNIFLLCCEGDTGKMIISRVLYF